MYVLIFTSVSASLLPRISVRSFFAWSRLKVIKYMFAMANFVSQTFSLSLTEM